LDSSRNNLLIFSGGLQELNVINPLITGFADMICTEELEDSDLTNFKLFTEIGFSISLFLMEHLLQSLLLPVFPLQQFFSFPQQEDSFFTLQHFISFFVSCLVLHKQLQLSAAIDEKLKINNINNIAALKNLRYLRI
jgi:hypothetical protein